MPVYEFRCDRCGERFEELVAAGTEWAPCRKCGADGAVRVLSAQAAPFGLVKSIGAHGSLAGSVVRSDGPQRRAAPADQGRLQSAPPARPGLGRGLVSASAEARREELIRLYREVETCTRCPLYADRTKAVFGSGNADADLMFIGEAPGAEEDRQGLPFVGRAGQLLTSLLGEIELRRQDVFIANILKSRPPGNRDPHPEEIEACWPYLERQIGLIEPKVIATLGNFATKKITGSQVGITRVSGTPQDQQRGRQTRGSAGRISNRSRIGR